MGQVRYSPRAAAKVKSLCDFYEAFDPNLSQRARDTIVKALNLLVRHPHIGRPYPERSKFRERVIPFGASHFVALYYFDESDGDIIVVAVKHEREFAYELDEGL